MHDHLIRVLAKEDTIRVSVASTTALVTEIHHRQETDPTATIAIGRLATAAALMGSLLKDNQRVGIIVEGNGPLGKLHAEADALGHVRASLQVPQAGLPPRNNRFDVAGAVGRAGFLQVIKDLGMKEPYRGMVQLVSSEIAEDLAYYFTTSEQTPSSVALGVELNQQAEVAAAGGFLVQMLPGADEAAAETLSARLESLPPTTSLLRQGLPPQALVEQILGETRYRILGTTALSFHCGCSRQQILTVLRTLGAEALDQMIVAAEDTTVTCEYCQETYPVDRQTLQAVRASL
jgi:molecular chaperone Hsp33